MENKQKYWFPAKRYGYGWGLPATWQGWLVLLIYVGATLGFAFHLTEPAELFWFVPLHLLLTALFLWIVWKTGEKTTWRWGNRQQTSTQSEDP